MSTDAGLSAIDEAIEQAKSAPFVKGDWASMEAQPLMCRIMQPGAVHVVECGHKFDPREQPRNNCNYCWYVYFDLHPAEVAAGASVIKVYGKAPIVKSRGEKYFKALKKAVEAYEWKQSQEQLAKQTASEATNLSQTTTESSQSTDAPTPETALESGTLSSSSPA